MRCPRCNSEISFLNCSAKCAYCGGPCCQQCASQVGTKICCSHCKRQIEAKSGPDVTDDADVLDGEMDF
jgi:hypothetical protein